MSRPKASTPKSSRTDQLSNRVHTKSKRTLLGGGIHFIAEERNDGHQKGVIHHIQESSGEGDDNNPLFIFTNTHGF